MNENKKHNCIEREIKIKKRRKEHTHLHAHLLSMTYIYLRYQKKSCSKKRENRKEIRTKKTKRERRIHHTCRHPNFPSPPKPTSSPSRLTPSLPRSPSQCRRTLLLPQMPTPPPPANASTFGHRPSLLLPHTSSPLPPAAAGSLPTGHRLDPDSDLPRGDRVAVVAENEHATRGDWGVVATENELATDGGRERACGRRCMQRQATSSAMRDLGRQTTKGDFATSYRYH